MKITVTTAHSHQAQCWGQCWWHHSPAYKYYSASAVLSPKCSWLAQNTLILSLLPSSSACPLRPGTYHCDQVPQHSPSQGSIAENPLLSSHSQTPLSRRNSHQKGNVWCYLTTEPQASCGPEHLLERGKAYLTGPHSSQMCSSVPA